MPAAAEQRDQQHGVQRPQPGHALRREVGTQPLRTRLRKCLDKCGDSLSRTT